MFFKGSAVMMSQQRWVVKQLNIRGYLHLKGTPCLPQVEEGKYSKGSEDQCNHPPSLINCRIGGGGGRIIAERLFYNYSALSGSSWAPGVVGHVQTPWISRMPCDPSLCDS